MEKLTLVDVKKELTKDLEDLVNRVNESSTSAHLMTVLNELEDVIMILENGLSKLVTNEKENVLKS